MSDTKQKPKRRRRWLSFSLRTLLVVVTIFCVVLAYWVYRANRQKAVVKWVTEKYWGEIYYDFQVDEKGEEIDDAKPPGPKWVQDFLGIDYFASVIAVEIDDSELIDIAPLAKLEHLQYLNIDGKFSDLTPLAKLTSLKILHLDDTQVSDLTPLAELTGLEELYFDNTQVSDLMPLAGMTSLETLFLDDTQVSDLTPLAGLESLTFLTLDNTQVSDLSPLAGLTSLKDLYLDGTEVSDLTPLMKLKSLTELWLNSTQVTQEQINELQKALPNCKIWWWPAYNINDVILIRKQLEAVRKQLEEAKEKNGDK